MFKYLFTHRNGRFLVYGVLALIIGFVLMFSGNPASRWVFYISIFFLGFYAAKDAVVDTIEERKLNVDLLMVLAALGAVVIDYESEGAMLLLIFAAAELLEEYAMNKSTRAISELMGNVPETAQLIKANGEIKEVATEDLQVGDRVLVARGQNIPIDGLTDRQVLVNEAALTGESLPVSKEVGAEVFAGTINEGDAFQMTVNKLASETVFSKIIHLVEEAQSHPSQIASFIDQIETKYVTGVLVTVPLFIAALYFGLSYTFQEAFYRGMVLLTVASPCALVASATPATLSAISNGAKHGILVKGGAAMESLATMDTLYSDKTGTLTYGEFDVVDYQISDTDLAEVVFMEQQSSHPIANAIVKHFKDADLTIVDQSQMVEEVPGLGVMKGDIVVGKPSHFASYNDPNNYRKFLEAENTTVFVARGKDIIGYISLADQVRPEARSAVQSFIADGIDVQLLTGDNELIAGAVAREVGITQYQAACLPEDKIARVKESQSEGQVVGMIGDGINDAPALANANIGIAMGSGSSVAMESGDIVVVKNNLAKLYHAFKLSEKLGAIIKQNVAFAVGVIVVLIILNLLGWLDLPAGVVFHEGSTILVILNGLRLLNYDAEDKGMESREDSAVLNQQHSA